MLDFSKWVDMWDAYYARGISGGAVPGSAASICWNIGFLDDTLRPLTVNHTYNRLPGSIRPCRKRHQHFLHGGAPHGRGVGVRVPRLARSYTTVIPATLTVHANHDDLESGRFGRMQERRSENARIKA